MFNARRRLCVAGHSKMEDLEGVKAQIEYNAVERQKPDVRLLNLIFNDVLFILHHHHHHHNHHF
jgi:hypothetical protein